MQSVDGAIKRVTNAETVRGTRSEAEKVLTAKLAKLDRGTMTPKPRKRNVADPPTRGLRAGSVSRPERGLTTAPGLIPTFVQRSDS